MVSNQIRPPGFPPFRILMQIVKHLIEGNNSIKTGEKQFQPRSPCHNDAGFEKHENQGQNLQSQMANLTDMLSKFVTANTASTFGSGTLPGNTVTNPKEDLKGITTRSGVTIQGPKAVNHDAEIGDNRTPMPLPITDKHRRRANLMLFKSVS
ncbi:hypothetical protein Tco_0345727 [Tanacetum coccineum]